MLQIVAPVLYPPMQTGAEWDKSECLEILKLLVGFLMLKPHSAHYACWTSSLAPATLMQPTYLNSAFVQVYAVLPHPAQNSKSVFSIGSPLPKSELHLLV